MSEGKDSKQTRIDAGKPPAPVTHAPARNTPVPDTKARPAPAPRSSEGDVADFLAQVASMTPQNASGANGRLVFAMDATMSRQPTWDLALSLQGDMFNEVKRVGGLDVQLVFFRGHGECSASKWVGNPDALRTLMTSVQCRGGRTQIEKVLKHARRETEKTRVNAVVYVGDCMEENIDDLAHYAGELGLLGLPVFLFQEGHDATAETGFREIARLTRGAWSRFDAGSAAQLRELLAAVAVYAAGGRKALADYSRTHGGGAQLLLAQLK